MEKKDLLEIANLAHSVADLITTQQSYGPGIPDTLFDQFRAVATACMQGLDLRPEIKNYVSASRLGELYRSVRYMHDMVTFNPEKGSDIRKHLLQIEEILREAIQRENPGNERNRGRDEANIEIHHNLGPVLIGGTGDNQQETYLSFQAVTENKTGRKKWKIIGFIGFVSSILSILGWLGLSPTARVPKSNYPERNPVVGTAHILSPSVVAPDQPSTVQEANLPKTTQQPTPGQGKPLETKAQSERSARSPEEIKAETQPTRTSEKQFNNRTKKSSTSLAREQQRLSQAPHIDQLMESLRPNMQVKLLKQVHWEEDVIIFTFAITNTGIWPIVVKPSILVKMHPRADLPVAQSGNSWSPSASIEICGGGLIPTKTEFSCAVQLRVSPSTNPIKNLTFDARFDSRTEISKDSETIKALASVYSDESIEKRLKYAMDMSGQISRGQ